MNPFEAKYTEEALELIAEIEALLLLWEDHTEDPSIIQQVFRNMHTLKGNSAMMGFKVIAGFTHHIETMYDYVRSGKVRISKEIINITLVSLDHLSLLIKSNKTVSDNNKTVHETLTANIVALINRLQNDIHNNDAIQPAEHHSTADNILQNNAASRKPEQVADNRKLLISRIRVPVERLDNLMSLVTELITLQGKLDVLAGQYAGTELEAVSESLEKISTRLRDNAFSMCLVPVEHMVTPFGRLVRDLAAELNKEIDFITEGTETELDKNMIEGLSDPLMHLLRNSIDHGIEAPDERITRGKPRHGKIILKTYCAGAHVYIEIQDDGKGINIQAIRETAIRKALITANDELNDKELLNLIFLPGFSTAEQVTGTSGRGVGMDVVKRKIADIRGEITIQSEPGAGTKAIIKLPLTLSIIDGLLVKINDADYVIPLATVDTCHEIPTGEQLNTFNNLIVVNGQLIPFINLQQELGISANTGKSREMVIMQYHERKVGLVVDSIAGKVQTVLKPLGKYFQHMDIISGGTIMGDGRVALVLDANKIMEQFINAKNIAVCQ